MGLDALYFSFLNILDLGVDDEDCFCCVLFLWSVSSMVLVSLGYLK